MPPCNPSNPTKKISHLTLPKKRKRGRPKGTKTRKKSQNSKHLQLPSLNNPKTVTRITLSPTPSLSIPPQIRPSHTQYTPIPHFPDIDIPFWDQSPFHTYFDYNQSPTPILLEFGSMNANNSEYIHPNKRRKIDPSVIDSENEPILESEMKQSNNTAMPTKRALFKENLSNININSNQTTNVMTETVIPTNITVTHAMPKPEQMHSNLPLQQTHTTHTVSAPVLENNNNNNLDWFGADENINTLNGNNHFEMNMFPMTMGDDMKDMGLPPFMMNDIIPNNDLMDMDIMHQNGHSNGNNGHGSVPHRVVKQENSNSALPPNLSHSNNNNYSHNYHNNLPRFSISSSPNPQQSSMFMDTINSHSSNANSNAHYQSNDYSSYNHRSNMHSNMRRSAQNGPNTVRPSNLPQLRTRAQSKTAANNNSNLGVDYVTKSNTQRQAKAESQCKNGKRGHVLTPFDYPLSNPAVTGHKRVSHNSHAYYSQYMLRNGSNNGTTQIKQERPQKKNNKSIHSAPLYSIRAVSDNNHSNHSNHSHRSNSHSLTPNARLNQNLNFSLSNSLLSIPQHLTHSTNQNRFPPMLNGHYSGNRNGGEKGAMHNGNGHSQTNFNFLWWYPEIKFCELDPQLVPLP